MKVEVYLSELDIIAIIKKATILTNILIKSQKTSVSLNKFYNGDYSLYKYQF